MKINLFYGDLECFLWTQSEIENVLENTHKDQIVVNRPSPYNFTILG